MISARFAGPLFNLIQRLAVHILNFILVLCHCRCRCCCCCKFFYYHQFVIDWLYSSSRVYVCLYLAFVALALADVVNSLVFFCLWNIESLTL